MCSAIPPSAGGKSDALRVAFMSRGGACRAQPQFELTSYLPIPLHAPESDDIRSASYARSIDIQWFGRDPALAESAVRRNNQERFPAHRRNDRDVRCFGEDEKGIPG